MKKKLLCILLGISMIGTMSGCSSKSSKKEENVPKEESILSDKYEKQHREVREPVYRTAATAFAGGDGSESSPYEISSAEELQYLSDLLADKNDRTSEYRKKNYILTADISLNDTSDYANWSENGPEYDWRPIGTEATFCGVFDGNGHTIRGLYMNADMEDDNTTDAKKNGGLFADVIDGTIKDLNLTDAYLEISGDALYTGAVAGYASKTEITDCTVDGLIIGYDGYYGGIAGSASGTIEGCEFDGIVKAAKNLDNDQAAQTYLGGIAGDFASVVPVIEDEKEAENFKGIVNCVNKGSVEVVKGSHSAQAAGGIAGMNSAKIENCQNEGTVNAEAGLTEEENQKGTASLSVGGIVGTFVIAVKGEDGVIRECKNTGNVSADVANAGGIAGEINLSDSRYQMTIENCQNSGSVFSANHYYAGIVADAGIKGDSTVTITGCTNETDFTEGEGAGIVHHLVQQNGNMEILDSVNHGLINSSGQNAAGILCYVANMGDNWKLKVENCENTANIIAKDHVGGILCFTSFYKSEDGNANTSFEMKNCKNSGNLSASTTNGYVGGILGVDGFMKTKTEISDCENSGDISFTKVWVMGEEDLKTEDEKGKKEDAEIFTLSVMGGGIVGRIGDAVLLSVDADKSDAKEINKKDALVTISNCKSTGALNYEEPQMGEGVTEEENKKAKEEKWKASMGGILGDCSCRDGYSVNFKNCTYRAERGLGNTDLPDIE